jgi:hypothetical protein
MGPVLGTDPLFFNRLHPPHQPTDAAPRFWGQTPFFFTRLRRPPANPRRSPVLGTDPLFLGPVLGTDPVFHRTACASQLIGAPPRFWGQTKTC